MVALGPLLAVATFAVAQRDAVAGRRRAAAPVLLADFVYALVVAAFVARRVAEMIAERRRRSAGSKLHLRLVRFFTAIALIPTVLVAVFATITLNFGLEGWFSDRVRNVVANSLQAAAGLRGGAPASRCRPTPGSSADFLDEQKERYPLLTGGELRDLLTRGQLQMQRALPKAYVIDGDGELRARGERSYLFCYKPPSAEDIARAAHRRGRRHPGLGEQRVPGAAAARRLRRPFPLCQPRGRRQDPEPARRDPGDGAALPAARGRPRAAAVRVRADLSRLRAGGDPRRDLDGPLVRRAAGAAGRPAGRRRRAGRAGRPRRAGARGEGRRRDRAARPHLQRDDPAGEGPARRADRRQRRDRAPAAAVRLGALGRHGRRGRPRRRGADRDDERRRGGAARPRPGRRRPASRWSRRCRSSPTCSTGSTPAERRRAGRGAAAPPRRASATCWCGWRRGTRDDGGARGLRRLVRRRDRPRRRAAHGGLGRRGAAHRPRGEEPADADPALGRAAAAQVRADGRRASARRSSNMPT